MQTETTELALPSQLRTTALAYPSKVQAALAKIGSTDKALELLRAGDGWMQLMKDYGADTEAVNSIQRGRLYVQAKLGGLMPAKTRQEAGSQKGKGGSPGEPPFAKEAMARFRKVAKSEDKIDAYFESASGGDEPVEMSTAGFINFVVAGQVHVGKNAGQVQWYTPDRILDAARETMGGFDVDPASSAIAQKRVRAKKYFTESQNGLGRKWQGRVWLNPPYSSGVVDKFVGKLCVHVQRGDVTQAILLTNNSTETKWFQAAAEVASGMCFPAGRVQFLDDQGNPGSPLQGQSLLYFGVSNEAFAAAFGGIGVVVQ